MKISNETATRWKYYGLIILCMLAAYSAIWMFTTRTPFMHAHYCSFSLQAERWLHGHLDLGQDRPWLELAIYQGKYFVSFPPLPTFFVLPFVALFGVEHTPEYFITTVLGIIGAIHLFKMFALFCKKETTALLWALFATISSNFLLIGYNGDVWLMAQTSAFMFSSIAFYYAATDREKDGKWPLLWLACAVGCRPLNILFLPVVLYFLYVKLKMNGLSLWAALKKHYLWLIAPALVGLFYMTLNFLRFDNPFQFGHDYLPEFTRDPINHPQFSLSFIRENFTKKLFGLPHWSEDHRLLFSKGGFAFFITSPIYAVGFLYLMKRIIDKVRGKIKTSLFWPIFLIVVCITINLLFMCAHPDMGGIQWGLRFTIDALPLACFGIAILLKEDDQKLDWILPPMLIFGLCLNLVGTLAILNDWSIFL